MTNDNSRHWAVLAPIDSGPTLTAQAQQVEAAGLAGIFSPQLYSSPFMTLGHCAAVTERVQLATGVEKPLALLRETRDHAAPHRDIGRDV